MPSPKRNKTVSNVRVWKRLGRRGRFYATLRLPGRKPVTRSCGTFHRSAAEQYAQILLVKEIKGTKPTAKQDELQLELPPPRTAGESVCCLDRPREPREHPAKPI